ncbi:hypothetical protein Tco_0852739 [Tanacetum coccineum]
MIDLRNWRCSKGVVGRARGIAEKMTLSGGVPANNVGSNRLQTINLQDAWVNDALWKDERRLQRLRELQMDADIMVYEKQKFIEKL